MAHGRINGAVAPLPPFSGRLTKVTGEGEQVEIAFTAETPQELAARLTAAGVSASERLATNNAVILRAADTFEERQRKIYDAAVTQVREEVTQMGRREEHEPPADEETPVGPPAPGDPADDEPEEESPPDADAAPRALHAPTDP
jgi:hypothetical protein